MYEYLYDSLYIDLFPHKSRESRSPAILRVVSLPLLPFSTLVLELRLGALHNSLVQPLLQVARRLLQFLEAGLVARLAATVEIRFVKVRHKVVLLARVSQRVLLAVRLVLGLQGAQVDQFLVVRLAGPRGGQDRRGRWRWIVSFLRPIRLSVLPRWHLYRDRLLVSAPFRYRWRSQWYRWRCNLSDQQVPR